MTAAPVIILEGVTKRFDAAAAIDDLSAAIRPGCITGLVGPDGAGKSTLLRLIDGLMVADAGRITVCGLDAARAAPMVHGIAGYMPQRFGLYEDLTVRENLVLYADLRGVTGAARRETFARLLAFTDLERFQERLAGRLSGGMKQKLGLACALVQKPRVLLLDEPSVGVDPISRRELWRMIGDLVDDGIAVIWSTSYLDEAERCAEVLLLHQGKLLHAGPPAQLTRRMDGRSFLVESEGHSRALLARALARPEVADGVVQGRAVRLVMAAGAPAPDAAMLGIAGALTVRAVPPRFEDAYVALLGQAAIRTAVPDPAVASPTESGVVIEAHGLTKRFGNFLAAADVGFAIRRGEIFGLLGPNGAGKSTTFKMMCGLMRPSAGSAAVEGIDLYRAGSAARRRIGYMAQKFSLYGDLSVAQNLRFFASAYRLRGARRHARIDWAETEFELGPMRDATARDLPLGFKQRLALACALMHEPEILFLDEPTSGVDPLARREFWRRINALAETGVTVLVTTHFMEEAEYCDRLVIMAQGKVLAAGEPEAIKQAARTAARPDPTMEDAFIAVIEAPRRPARAA
ncbi:MAG TPA: ATP-binding cassette domain-containing protein [Stellaceae bacterium]|nr:ATP-binding cassette domain-containing protein [Stellaceae bacterium]